MTMTSSVATDAYPRLTLAQVRGSDRGQWHTSTEPSVVAALAHVPGYVETRRTVVELHRRVASAVAPKPRPAEDALREALVDLITSGRPLPDDLSSLIPPVGAVPVYEGRNYDLGIAIVVNADELLLARATERALASALRDAQGHLDSLLDRGGSHVLGAISDRLVALVDRARKVMTDRGVIVDAEDAIEQGRVEEYRASQELQREYAELRRLQVLWGSSVQNLSGGPGQRAFLRFISNPLEVWPVMPRVVTQAPYADPDVEARFHREAFAAREPWPTSWCEPETLWWFAQHTTAIPWAPSDAQYEDATRKLHLAYNDHRSGSAQPARTKGRKRVAR